MKHVHLTLLGFACLFIAQASWANNVTISDFLSAEGLEMAASPASCDSVETQIYQEVGTVSVSFTADYELADAGNLLGFTGTGQGIVDVVINVYEDNFDPVNPGNDRIASVDEGDVLALEAGKSYILVIQPYCENVSGVFGVVLRGSGNISGAGFETAVSLYGQHTVEDDLADFPQGIGLHAYDVSDPRQVPDSGLYYFGEVGTYFNADLALLAYEDSFNPADTSENLVGVVSFAGALLLESGQDYVFVAVDQSDLGGPWQYVLFPPGPVRFTESLKGAWVTPGVEGSGILMEIGTKTGILFFAWFTFPEPPPPVIESLTDTGLDAELGSVDQRWLTGFGLIDPNSSQMNIKYENTTGGFFNEMNPVPVTDSNYGSGTVEVTDCLNLVITYDLPAGISGTAPMTRTITDGLQDCLESVNAGPLMPEV